MSTSNENQPNEELGIENVEQVVNKAEEFIESNQKKLLMAFGIIASIVVGIIVYNKYILAPQEIAAQEVVFYAEEYFAQDSFRLALNGDGNHLGFLDVIDSYKSTSTGNLAYYYAGICYLKMGNYDQAIEYLKLYDIIHGERMIGSISLGAIGDAYVEKEDYDSAINYYKKAAALGANNFSSPIYLMKLAGVYESKGDYSTALMKYEEIRERYPNTTEGRSISKYIARVKSQL